MVDAERAIGKQPDIEVSIVSKSLKVPGSTHHRVSSSLGGNSLADDRRTFTR